MSSSTGVMRRAVVAFSIRSRRRKAAQIVGFMQEHAVADVVLVGCGGPLGAANKNARIVESAVGAHATITLAIDVDHYDDLPWPFLQADGRDLPLEDASTDMVLANAVIEHVGDEADQVRFVAEQSRVGRSWVITTPNRWFPVESHTSAVLRHWSPRWRADRTEFTRLLSLGEFKALLPADTVVIGKPWSATFVAFHAPATTPA